MFYSFLSDKVSLPLFPVVGVTTGLCILLTVFILVIRSDSLKQFLGPFVARLTNVWRFLDVYSGRAVLTQLKFHRRYGSAVRLGPNIVSISDPALIKNIYQTRNTWSKAGIILAHSSQALRLLTLFRVTSIRSTTLSSTGNESKRCLARVMKPGILESPNPLRVSTRWPQFSSGKSTSTKP